MKHEETVKIPKKTNPDNFYLREEFEWYLLARKLLSFFIKALNKIFH